MGQKPNCSPCYTKSIYARVQAELAPREVGLVLGGVGVNVAEGPAVVGEPVVDGQVEAVGFGVGPWAAFFAE